ncbi:heterokaryon incompatibility protein-domain-containing protein [Xylaria sp. FL0933]|nr:heterokaryon incompatibility protein-domain-containing protein [Xylaria sp. FL0933]
MRLLHVKTQTLKEFSPDCVPKYAILSHCWKHGENGPIEILYEDVESSRPTNWRSEKKEAAQKVLKACAEADRLGYEWIWIDTCCIDKRSSAELSEAINSMFSWYRNSGKCIAFLDDIMGYDDLGLDELITSRWFMRGWTLQELIAPDNVWFYNKEWSFIGDRFSMAKLLSTITGIDEVVLRHGHEPERENWDDHHYIDRTVHYDCYCHISSFDKDILRGVLDTFSVATIMSWAAERKTTREEDLAYCLMGLFDVNMPLLYGEKSKAFRRLQEEIIRRSDDQSILAWVTTTHEDNMNWFLGRDLASCPDDFAQVKIKKKWSLEDPDHDDSSRRHMSVTKEGIEVDLFCLPIGLPNQFTEEKECYMAVLDCTIGNNPLSKPALIIEKPPWSTNIYDRFISFMLAVITPEAVSSADGSVYKGVATIASNTAGFDENWREENWTYRQEFDLSKGEMRRITLAHILLRRGTHSRNRFLAPPLRIGRIMDCDAGEYAVDYPLPDFDKMSKIARASNEYYGLVLLTKKSCQFFVAWGPHYFFSSENQRERAWCKVLPAREDLRENFAAAKEWGRHQRYESTSEFKHLMDGSLLRFDEVNEVHKAVLDLGPFSREVMAEVKYCHFLGATFVELTLDITLPSQES